MPAHDEDCRVTEEKQLLQSSGRVQNQMVSAVDATWEPNTNNWKGGFIIQAPGSKECCVDIPAAKLENAKKGLQTWECHQEWKETKKSQGFWYKNGEIHPTQKGDWCLDALGASRKKGEEAINSKVGLHPCNGQTNQKFVIRPYINSKAYGSIMAEDFGLCVDRHLTLQKCSQDTIFAMPGYQQFPGFQIRSNVGGHLCFDIPAQKIENSAELQMYPCHEKGRMTRRRKPSITSEMMRPSVQSLMFLGAWMPQQIRRKVQMFCCGIATERRGNNGILPQPQ